MNNRYAYLVDDDSHNFFQKVAEEQAVSELPKPKPRIALETVKTAAPIETQTPFEKIAGRLEADIEIIKMAGTSGIDMGATDRAMNYMSRLERDPSISDDEYVFIFDKVAFAALEEDFSSARADLHVLATPDRQEVIDIELGKIASELVAEFHGEWGDVFSIEKSANLTRILTGSRTGVRLAKGSSKLEGVIGRAGAKAKKWIARSGKTERGGKVLQRAAAKAGPAVRNVRSMPSGVRAWWRQGVKARAGRKLKGVAARERAAVTSHAEALKRSNAAKAGAEASKIRRLSKQKQTAKGKFKTSKTRLEEATTIRGTAKQTGKSKGAAKAKAEKSRGKAKAEAAGAVAKGEEAVAAGKAGAAAPMSRKRREAEAGWGRVTGEKAPTGAAAKVTEKASKAKGGGGTTRRGKREGITRAEAEHRKRNKGRKRTSRMRETFRTPPTRSVSTRSPAAARETMGRAKQEGWWGSLSDKEKKNIAMAAGAGVLAGNVLD